MNKKRKERVKRKKLAKQKFQREQKALYKWARDRQAITEYAIFSKPEGGKWRVEFTSPHEVCRDSAFEIMKLRTDLEVRRVDV